MSDTDIRYGEARGITRAVRALTRTLDSYGEARREGCDAAGAWDVFRETFGEALTDLGVCPCPPCRADGPHEPGCAVHHEPAAAGRCDCGARP